MRSSTNYRLLLSESGAFGRFRMSCSSGTKFRLAAAEAKNCHLPRRVCGLLPLLILGFPEGNKPQWQLTIPLNQQDASLSSLAYIYSNFVSLRRLAAMGRTTVGLP
jgi:hypothetical protein